MTPIQPRKIKCRNCGKPTVYAAENPFRPFCSERCRLIDLGDWAAGNHRLPSEENVSPMDSEFDASSKDDSKEFDEQ
jgi:endogenous inhibitor of DNA gyrase (YacG/DUF329 family)